MHIEFLVEEYSAELALYNLIPRIVGDTVSYKIVTFQGKSDMLAKLPARLRGYRAWIPDDFKIVVLMDLDADNCNQLKADLERIAGQAGFVTKSAAHGAPCQILNRIAIEELEAWFFGDVEAICHSYPRVNRNLARKAKYRDPDAIRGGTWEALERELQRAGYFAGGMGKAVVAQEVSMHMLPERNRSRSFQIFATGILELVA